VLDRDVDTSVFEARAPEQDALLSVRDLVVEFPGEQGNHIRALRGISLDVKSLETFAVVGESGCGKTTLARTVVGLQRPTSGAITFESFDIARAKKAEMAKVRRRLQMIFQDPYGSLDPHMTIRALIGEALRLKGLRNRREIEARVAELMDMVGLPADSAQRKPHEFSGGQRQRIGIARAIAVEPQLIVCDEPTSALDVSVQAQVLALLAELKTTLGMTYLFISHNLAVIRNVSDRVAVMYLGQVVEQGRTEDIFRSPRHPYTKALLHVVPDVQASDGIKPRRSVLRGEIPSPSNPPSGCSFRTRCPLAIDKCAQREPELRVVGAGQAVACWRSDDVPAWQPTARS
jgi:oligopeptide/dipeptide ABC transporter ATP-binding protein